MQEMKLTELSEKIFLYHIGELSSEETQKLEALMEENEHIRKIVLQLKDSNTVRDELHKISQFDPNKAYNAAYQKINAPKGRLLNMVRWCAAAAIILVSLMVLARYFSPSAAEGEIIFSSVESTDEVQLRLSDGSIILMDTLSFLNADGAQFSANNDILAVNVSENVKPFTRHELRVPYRRKQQIILSDGSKVFLNAGSKLVFPAEFDNQRKVNLEGEGYFEIQPSDKPFIVETADQTIQVYGTTFNVRAYPDEQIHYTELIEGSVSLRNRSSPEEEVFLEPGQQAKYSRTEGSINLTSINNSVVAGWKDGWLAFENKPTSDVLKQIGRWYNLDIALDNHSILKTPITGKILLYPDVKDLLSKIEKLGDLTFVVSQDQILVKHIRNK